jgi:hypothetical protein
VVESYCYGSCKGFIVAVPSLMLFFMAGGMFTLELQLIEVTQAATEQNQMGNLTFANEVGLRIEDPSILMMPGT